MECLEDFVHDMVRAVYGPGYQVVKRNGAPRKSSHDEWDERVNEVMETLSIEECSREVERLKAEIAAEKDRLNRRASEVLDTLRNEEELCSYAGYKIYERTGVHLTSERLRTLRREMEIIGAARTRLAMKRLREILRAEIGINEDGDFEGTDMENSVEIIATEEVVAPVSP